MTSYWGPLGWATLHTVAALYPERPSEEEQSLLRQWITSFGTCITCPSCQGHFLQMVNTYSSRHPNWYTSRAEFTLFMLRAHNTVNRRSGKKVYNFVESINELERLYTHDFARARRREYLQYLQKDWGRLTTLSGISTLIRVRELNMTEQEYWSIRRLDWNDIRNIIPENTDIMTPITAAPPQSSMARMANSGSFNMSPQRFRLPSGSTAGFGLMSK